MNFKCDRSYINSPNYIKSTKTIVNTINENGNRWIQYAATTALNHEKKFGTFRKNIRKKNREK